MRLYHLVTVSPVDWVRGLLFQAANLYATCSYYVVLASDLVAAFSGASPAHCTFSNAYRACLNQLLVMTAVAVLRVVYCATVLVLPATEWLVSEPDHLRHCAHTTKHARHFAPLLRHLGRFLFTSPSMNIFIFLLFVMISQQPAALRGAVRTPTLTCRSNLPLPATRQLNWLTPHTISAHL